MRRTLLVLASVTSVVLAAGCGSTDTVTPTKVTYGHAASGSLRLTGGWVSADPMAGMSMSEMPGMGAPASVAYGVVTNDSSQPDALVSVSSPQVGRATLHGTRVSADGTTGTMVPAADIAVPAHGHLSLDPGGYHIMLRRLRADFAVGSSITLTWTFRSGKRLTAAFPVIDPADRP